MRPCPAVVQFGMQGGPGPIGRVHHVVVDCREPGLLARFYAALLGLPVTYGSDDWVVIAENDRSSGFAFQLAADHEPPCWPNPARPQQFHLDVMVDDPAAADEAVRRIGATVLDAAAHVYSDPAGHPFCLIPRPDWAPPVQPGDEDVVGDGRRVR